jgi:hypothetical protein
MQCRKRARQRENAAREPRSLGVCVGECHHKLEHGKALQFFRWEVAGNAAIAEVGGRCERPGSARHLESLREEFQGKAGQIPRPSCPSIEQLSKRGLRSIANTTTTGYRYS